MKFSDAQLSLDSFDRPLDDVAGVDPDVRRQIREKIKQRLTTLAAEMLDRAGLDGVGFDDIRQLAKERGILTGTETWLSCGSMLMQTAKGVPVRYRRSKIKASARRRVAVYVHEKFSPGVQSA